MDVCHDPEASNQKLDPHTVRGLSTYRSGTSDMSATSKTSKKNTIHVASHRLCQTVFDQQPKQNYVCVCACGHTHTQALLPHTLTCRCTTPPGFDWHHPERTTTSHQYISTDRHRTTGNNSWKSPQRSTRAGQHKRHGKNCSQTNSTTHVTQRPNPPQWKPQCVHAQPAAHVRLGTMCPDRSHRGNAQSQTRKAEAKTSESDAGTEAN